MVTNDPPQNVTRPLVSCDHCGFDGFEQKMILKFIAGARVAQGASYPVDPAWGQRVYYLVCDNCGTRHEPYVDDAGLAYTSKPTGEV